MSEWHKVTYVSHARLALSDIVISEWHKVIYIYILPRIMLTLYSRCLVKCEIDIK